MQGILIKKIIALSFFKTTKFVIHSNRKRKGRLKLFLKCVVIIVSLNRNSRDVGSDVRIFIDVSEIEIASPIIAFRRNRASTTTNRWRFCMCLVF